MADGVSASRTWAQESSDPYVGVETEDYEFFQLTAIGGVDQPGTWMEEWGIWNRSLSDAEVDRLHFMGQNGIPLPEPATLGLLVMGLLALKRRRA